jgi:putative solute:sodium symporter small subunit
MTAPPSDERERRHWRRSLRLTAALLGVWFVVTFGVAWFARDLRFSLFGFPFPFWVAAQGAPIVYLLIIWFYARAMNRLDGEHDAADARA